MYKEAARIGSYILYPLRTYLSSSPDTFALFLHRKLPLSREEKSLATHKTFTNLTLAHFSDEKKIPNLTRKYPCYSPWLLLFICCYIPNTFRKILIFKNGSKISPYSTLLFQIVLHLGHNHL